MATFQGTIVVKVQSLHTGHGSSRRTKARLMTYGEPAQHRAAHMPKPCYRNSFRDAITIVIGLGVTTALVRGYATIDIMRETANPMLW